MNHNETNTAVPALPLISVGDSSIMNSRFLVVGAGISGITIANLFSQDPDATVTVIDSKGTIGGNCYDYRNEYGITVHKYGSHIFHTQNEDVWHFVQNHSRFNTYMHRVYAVIEGNEVPIPFNFDSIYQCFPPTLAERLEKKLLEKYGFGRKVPIKDFMEQDDEDLRFLAQYVYEHVFKNYTSKQWGLKPDEMDGAVTARVPIYLSRDCRYFQDRYQGIP